nr:hypothetical protein [Tanacetum cinerariifolium]
SPRVDELPMMPQDPYSYVEATLQAPPSPDYVPGPEHPPSPAYASEFVLKPEEEEHLASADFVPPPVHRVTARMFVRVQTPISLLSGIEVARLLAIPTPPPSPLSPLSLPLPSILSPLHYILSPPLPIPSLPLPASPTYLLGYRTMMIRLRAESPSTSHLPPPIVLLNSKASMAMLRATVPSMYILAPRLETPPSRTPPLLPIPLHASSPPLLLPSTRHRADVPEVTLPLQKSIVDEDCRIAGNGPHMTDIASRGTDSTKDTIDTDGSIAKTAGTR